MWVELKKRADCVAIMEEGLKKSLEDDYENCTIYACYRVRNDFFVLSDWYDDASFIAFCNGKIVDV